MIIPHAAASGTVSVERLIPYMTEKMRARYASLPFKPKSAVIAAFPYNSGGDGNIARYARAGDYHEVVFRYLRGAVGNKKGYTAVKNGWPLPLVPAARLAGVGFTGRHGLQIVEPYGSYISLGAILCEDDLPETGDTAGLPPLSCRACRACESACPTGAMSFDGSRRVLNRELCIACITQTKEPERLDLLQKSKYIWGCDICQEVCPYNRGAALTKIPEFQENLICGFEEYVPKLPGRHYSGKEPLLLRNMNMTAAAKSAESASTDASVIQTFSITPV